MIKWKHCLLRGYIIPKTSSVSILLITSVIILIILINTPNIVVSVFVFHYFNLHSAQSTADRSAHCLLSVDIYNHYALVIVRVIGTSVVILKYSVHVF